MEKLFNRGNLYGYTYIHDLGGNSERLEFRLLENNKVQLFNFFIDGFIY